MQLLQGKENFDNAVLPRAGAGEFEHGGIEEAQSLIHFLQAFQFVGREGREPAAAAEMAGQLLDEIDKRPAPLRVGQDGLVIDAAGVAAHGLLVLLNEQVEIVVCGLAQAAVGCRRWRRGRTLLACVPRADAAILAVERIDEHRVERPERIVADLDFVAAETRIDAEEDVEQLDIGKSRCTVRCSRFRK